MNYYKNLTLWLPQQVISVFYATWYVTIRAIPSSKILNLFTFLNKSTLSRFKVLSDLTIVDNLTYFSGDFTLTNNIKKRSGFKHFRFTAYYNLLSVSLNKKLTVEHFFTEGSVLPSLSFLYNSANWLEREAYDMFGVWFSNHPDFRRILTDYGFSGHPLKKDFPVTGFYELFYDISQEKLLYKKIELAQFFRLTSLF